MESSVYGWAFTTRYFAGFSVIQFSDRRKVFHLLEHVEKIAEVTPLL
jgi:hypothetical protein